MNGRPDALIANVHVVTPGGVVSDSWLRMQDGRIDAIGRQGEPLPAEAADVAAEIVDGRGGYAVPGFIDLHVHGGAGSDFMDEAEDGLAAITRFHAVSGGTTALLATSMTAAKADIDGFLGRIEAFRQAQGHAGNGGMGGIAGIGGIGAKVIGVHLEGPFISPRWPGAQDAAWIVPPQLAWLEAWHAAYPGLIRMQTLAPEADGALPYISRLHALGIVSACGHTDASYEQVEAAVACGLRHAVHTFNAMRPFHHREPGTAGAVLTNDAVIAEIVADGRHVHPAGIRLLLAAKGIDRVALVTDAMMAAGMPDASYTIGGLPVVVQSGTARLKDGGGLAGSVLTMLDAFRFVMREAGVSIADASRMASGNPARQIGIDGETGALVPGLAADVLLLDSCYALRRVWIDGRSIV